MKYDKLTTLILELLKKQKFALNCVEVHRELKDENTPPYAYTRIHRYLKRLSKEKLIHMNEQENTKPKALYWI